MTFRLESDSIGSLQVPSEAYYGVQTLRAKNNFFITGYRLNPIFISSLAYVKKAAAICNMEAETIQEDVAKTIIQAADEIISGKFRDQFITDVIQGGAGTSMNMNMNEVIANRANELLGGALGTYDKVHPNDHVNFGQSTNDVVPTSGKLTIQFLLRDLLKNLEDLYSTFQSKATQYDHIIKMGRTHLQDAVPIRVGQEFRAFSGPVKRDIERLKSAMYELSFVNMGATAVGTGLNADINYIQRVVEVLSEVTGFSFSQCEDLVDGTRNLDSFVYLSSILKTCAVNLSKTANDIRLMSSGPKAGIAELILPQEQPGSSIMPGKVNPVIPEVMNQVCFQIFGNDVTITKAAEAGQLELNVFEPVLFFNLFQSIQILTNGIRTFIDNCIAGIQVNEEDCKYWLTRSVGVVTALSPHIGYKVAAEIAKLSLKTGKPVYDLVLEQGLLEKEKLDIILNPFEMTKPGIAGKELLKHD
ncbi:putative aspartate ammonia-lyase [Fusobacterium necrophorum subsp. funduliforme ATCC 51357]|uniref:Aspartate ammonia-lyase n=1 Tax=Fusobacterium necrophorum subsp. funduliforme TaxID=143387 RepID=A0A162IZ40_9FUSO|nr:aspartate ammonia-lyase [Fusobacterium necrophorum]AYV92800.1 aspartate ammonia-lyase [Fusobacterium necrophorum subsp. funduliforme]EIJ68027.1 putative aspartate ammonia-lyase [Fusobacterium necrophorum subsp. funduliforme ATCC 51357]KAB0553917.1 aspartate ammonia-lyase [Fusobacterium necrophorum subsp. funduliforme]KYL04740.1 aspartate ammonia-lyase [Fusobacterium necrophorum subsp. funduliforme]KYM44344.1 aspartate ammonia-lyase [Fusobacterium necrophorum subsp. funduliforme]